MKIRPAGIITKIVIVALILYASISLFNLKSRIDDARADLSSLQFEVEQTERKNAELQYEIEHSEDDVTIENVARTKLGLVSPGEKVFYVISN
jgi:Septum formation initiator